MNIRVFGPHEQGVGEFDGGKIVEQKPIGFPHEKGAVDGLGPLFYWAWAYAKEEGYIPPHPHKAFEIITYVIEGEGIHEDSLGTNSIVRAGGIQVMQTGTGVYHAERFKKGFEGFQIWFEPNLHESIRQQPTYHQFEDKDFPVTEYDGIRVKTVIGKESPVKLVADVQMWDVIVPEGKTYSHTIQADHALAALAVRGEGKWLCNGNTVSFHEKEFSVLKETESKRKTVNIESEKTLRLILIEVPSEVDYPLYRETYR